MQTPGSIDYNHINITFRLGAFKSVKRHRSRVGSKLLFHNRHIRSVRPLLKLFDSGSAECICRAQHNFISGIAILSRELADCCGFTCAIDTHYHNDIGLSATLRQSEIRR